ncbi:LacI family DNA-binding transcriptional regulator [Paenibacillus sp. HJL G12]|uniref:LacI family DNA-binding transcriptional regulator n=1 Tax=Paenibacillus dendrobii TaxID=2691084 RepID=A0A7X3LHI2_9BACL|nr:substrate-binding domain-containing protein [Paenibacillus dendrobii]MWV43264.1 LacI family DNA-binding transcriptional regulator [Paenibacillus dendrobii]
MATLKDIADVVGVSVSTVSRVLSNETNRSVNSDTKKKIWDTARELGYQIRSSGVLTPQTKRVGCIVSTLQNRRYHPYFSVILEGIDQELAKNGFKLAFTYTQDELKKPEVLKSALHDNTIEGLILIEGIDESIYRQIRKQNCPVVGIDVTDSSIPTISYDRVGAAQKAVQHLTQQGHRDILFIGGTGLSGLMEREKRFRGYQQALGEAQIPLDPARVLDAQWEPDQAYRMMLAFLEDNQKELPTAVFAASDIMAMAAMRAISEKGFRIPQDFAVVGFDDNEPSRYTVPPLSTIHIPTFEIGTIAAKTLLQTIRDPYPLPVNISVPFETKFRSSSKWSVTTKNQ